MVSRGGRTRRLITLLIAGACGALLQAGVAQAAGPTTSITSPGDPAYYLDSTGGAADASGNPLGFFTVTGTSTGLDPSTDTVDIDCFTDDDNASGTGYEESTLVSGVTLNSSGGFSAQVPYSAIEGFDPSYPSIYQFQVNAAADNPDGSVCRLRAIPASLEEGSGTNYSDLGSFSGPRVLLAYLALDYGDGTGLSDYTLVAPQLDATDVYESLGDCGLLGSYLNDQTYFGQTDAQGFNCADTTAALLDETGGVEVDGNDTETPVQAGGGLGVSVAQNQTDGDITVVETDPLFNDDGSSDGVQIDRTIQQDDSGNVVLITDKFVSTDGNSHQVILNSENEQCFLSAPCGTYLGSFEGIPNGFDPSDVSYSFPGSGGVYSTYPDGANPTTPLSEGPGTILIHNNGADVVGSPDPDADVAGSITYFTTPYDYYDDTFPDAGGQLNYSFQEPAQNPPATDPTYENALDIPYTFAVTPSTPVSLSFAYTTDSSQANVTADVTAAANLQASGENVGGTPAPVTSTTTYTTPTTAPTPAPVAGSASLTNVESAQVTAWVGPTYHPIANTGRASRAGHSSEHLKGDVIAGSGAVAYYFEYGTTKRYGHRTRTVQLTAGESIHDVSLPVKALHRGTTYHYRLLAVGPDGDAIGADRTFTAGKP